MSTREKHVQLNFKFLLLISLQSFSAFALGKPKVMSSKNISLILSLVIYSNSSITLSTGRYLKPNLLAIQNEHLNGQPKLVMTAVKGYRRTKGNLYLRLKKSSCLGTGILKIPSPLALFFPQTNLPSFR